MTQRFSIRDMPHGVRNREIKRRSQLPNPEQRSIVFDLRSSVTIIANIYIQAPRAMYSRQPQRPQKGHP
jgi:hypothetical protein